MKKIITVLTLLASATASFALSATGQFVPTKLYISGEANYHVRVSGMTPGMCKYDFAYINLADSGAKSYIATLMNSYTAKKPINVIYSLDSQNFCHIIELESD